MRKGNSDYSGSDRITKSEFRTRLMRKRNSDYSGFDTITKSEFRTKLMRKGNSDYSGSDRITRLEFRTKPIRKDDADWKFTDKIRLFNATTGSKTYTKAWPTKQGLTLARFECLRCKRDKGNPKLFSEENDIDPGTLPLELQGLTDIEEMLIARACPIMCVYRKHGGQRGYRGRVFPKTFKVFLIGFQVMLHTSLIS